MKFATRKNLETLPSTLWTVSARLSISCDIVEVCTRGKDWELLTLLSIGESQALGNSLTGIADAVLRLAPNGLPTGQGGGKETT